jgi:hypothetical protein
VTIRFIMDYVLSFPDNLELNVRSQTGPAFTAVLSVNYLSNEHGIHFTETAPTIYNGLINIYYTDITFRNL